MKGSSPQRAPSEEGRRNPATPCQHASSQDSTYAGSTNSDGFVEVNSTHTSSEEPPQASYKNYHKRWYNNWNHGQGKGYHVVSWKKKSYDKTLITHYEEEEVVPLTAHQLKTFKPYHDIGYYTSFAGANINAARATAAAAVAFCDTCHCSFPRRDATVCYYDKDCTALVDRSASQALIDRTNALMKQSGK